MKDEKPSTIRRNLKKGIKNALTSINLIERSHDIQTIDLVNYIADVFLSGFGIKHYSQFAYPESLHKEMETIAAPLFEFVKQAATLYKFDESVDIFALLLSETGCATKESLIPIAIIKYGKSVVIDNGYTGGGFLSYISNRLRVEPLLSDEKVGATAYKVIVKSELVFKLAIVNIMSYLVLSNCPFKSITIQLSGPMAAHIVITPKDIKIAQYTLMECEFDGILH